MIPCRIGGGYATEEAQSDRIGRSVPGQAGPDHQYEARAGSARRQGRMGLDRRRVAPLCSENGRPGIATRFMIGLLLHLHRHQQPPGARRPVRAARQCATR